VFFLNLNLKPELAGADCYAFLNHICQGKELPENTPAGSILLFSILPCNIIALKLLLFGMLFAGTLIISKMGSLFDRERGWVAGFLVFLAPGWIGESLKLEDDIFGFIFLLAATYFMMRGIKNNEWKSKTLGFGLILGSLLFWQGGVLYLFGFAFNFLLCGLASLPVIITKAQQLIETISFNFRIQENVPLWGMLMWIWLLVGASSVPAMLVIPFWFFLAIGVINAKFALHVIPFLAVGTTLYYWKPGRKGEKKKNTLRDLFVIYVFIMLIFAGISIAKGAPTEQQMQATEYAVEYAKQTRQPLHNDWSFGYWVEYHGGEASAKGGFVEQHYTEKGIVLTTQKLHSCNTLKQFGKTFVYEC